MKKSKQGKWFAQHPILSVLLVIFALFFIAYFFEDKTSPIQEKNSDIQPEVIKEEQKPSLNYNADKILIKSGLQTKGYTVIKIDFSKNPKDFYVLLVMIDTKGNYDQEVLDAYKIMHKHAVADYYMVGIIDYEFQTSWSFTATQKTLDDFFSGKITESEYIKQVEAERLI